MEYMIAGQLYHLFTDPEDVRTNGTSLVLLAHLTTHIHQIFGHVHGSSLHLDGLPKLVIRIAQPLGHLHGQHVDLNRIISSAGIMDPLEEEKDAHQGCLHQTKVHSEAVSLYSRPYYTSDQTADGKGVNVVKVAGKTGGKGKRPIWHRNIVQGVQVGCPITIAARLLKVGRPEGQYQTQTDYQDNAYLGNRIPKLLQGQLVVPSDKVRQGYEKQLGTTLIHHGDGFTEKTPWLNQYLDISCPL